MFLTRVYVGCICACSCVLGPKSWKTTVPLTMSQDDNSLGSVRLAYIGLLVINTNFEASGTPNSLCVCWMYIWRAQDIGCLFLICSPSYNLIFPDGVYHWTWHSLMSLNQPSLSTPTPHCPSFGITDAFSYTQLFKCGCWALSLGLHDYSPSTLPTEPLLNWELYKNSVSKETETLHFGEFYFKLFFLSSKHFFQTPSESEKWTFYKQLIYDVPVVIIKTSNPATWNVEVL